ncbi:hypothetical protein DRO02_02230 [archaeon]|nr:MAG: hypothetical protein DRO21_02770 [archaeon]RLG65373.1 MAG: hypothetical protein DRO02_02230 [archaeon]RLG66549.1 MAG: hypothetical protein DRN89_00655 [archaeon]HDM23445.1 DUF131 domain-containing protein [Candidatus Bathyarchaeota archaeon]
MIQFTEFRYHSLIGVILIVLGILLIFLGAKSLKTRGRQIKYDGFGLILIGPFPIILGVSSRFKLLTLITTVLTAILILVVILYYM